MIRMKKRMPFCFFGILFFVQSLIADGFRTGTLVKTATGFVPIEQLQVSDEVFCFDLANAYVIRPITHVATRTVDSYMKLCIDGIYLHVAPEQILYLPQEDRWIEAQDLTLRHVLCSCNTGYVTVGSVELIEQKVSVYTITVAEYHNLCVSQRGLIAHNFFPLIGAGVWLSFGAGAVQWGMGLVAGIGMLGSVLGLTLSKNSDDKKGGFTITPTANEGDSVNMSSPGGLPGGPDKRNDDTYENMYEVFKRAPIGEVLKKGLEKTKHHAQGQKIWRAVKDMIEYGIKKGDYLYLDNLHNNHIEVFKSYGEGLIRTVLNLDGSCNETKLKIAEKAVRTIWTYIRT